MALIKFIMHTKKKQFNSVHIFNIHMYAQN